MTFFYNWGSCLLGVSFNDDDRALHLYLGPFCVVIPYPTFPDRSKPA